MMLFSPDDEQRLSEVEDYLRRAKTITAEILVIVLARACPRFQVQHPAAKAKVVRLIESAAFTDATLALLDLELSGWTLHRLLHDNGEWYCSLSKWPNLPAEFDEPADATHAVLPLAILIALVRARRMILATREVWPKSVPRVRLVPGYIACCDNFR
jgi:hypothetical protein